MGVLADPTDPRNSGKISFQHRTGIDEDPSFDMLRAKPLHLA